MRGKLFLLSQAFSVSLTSIRQRRDGEGFYVVTDGKTELKALGIKTVTDGRFVNFYPEDLWYKEVAEAFYKIDEFPFQDKDIYEKCKSYTKIKEDENAEKGKEILIEEIFEEQFSLKDITAKDSKKKLGILASYKIALNSKGDELFINDKARKLILSMSFLERDMMNTALKKDYSFLYKLAKGCAELYLDYYYSLDIDKKSAGYISQSFFNFIKVIFYLFGAKSLQEQKNVI